MRGIHIAAYYDYVEEMALLLKHGADVNRKITDSYTPLHYACFFANHGAARLLVPNARAGAALRPSCPCCTPSPLLQPPCPCCTLLPSLRSLTGAYLGRLADADAKSKTQATLMI